MSTCSCTAGRCGKSLPTAIQKLITAAAVEAGIFQRDFNDEQDVKLIASLKEAGMQVNEVDKLAFMEKAKPMYAEYAKTYGDDAANSSSRSRPRHSRAEAGKRPRGYFPADLLRVAPRSAVAMSALPAYT